MSVHIFREEVQMQIFAARCTVTCLTTTIALRTQNLEPSMALPVETDNGALRENV